MPSVAVAIGMGTGVAIGMGTGVAIGMEAGVAIGAGADLATGAGAGRGSNKPFTFVAGAQLPSVPILTWSLRVTLPAKACCRS